MKNSKPYDGDAFDFYKTVCMRKQDDNLKARLLLMDPTIQMLYQNYDNHFGSNTLELMNSHGYIGPEKDDLETLYVYDSFAIRKLREKLATTDSGRDLRCQHCTINDVHTLDHLVPQGEFTEFNVHPKNLVCCCGDCNGRKNAVWRTNAGRTTLNLYTDKLPDEQYLFFHADIGNSTIEYYFYLDNRTGIDPALFNLITEHYRRLNLFERFADGADSVITSFKETIKNLQILPDPNIRKTLIENFIKSEQLANGTNYWQSVLKLELFNNDDFMIDFE